MGSRTVTSGTRSRYGCMLLIGAVAGGVWFGLFVLAQVGTLAARPVRNRAAVTLMLFAGALVGALLSAALLPADLIPAAHPTSHRLMALLAAALVMSCGFVLYMPLYYTVATSLS